MSREAYAEHHGQATVDHRSTGRADVYVSGHKVGSSHGPGRTPVTV